MGMQPLFPDLLSLLVPSPTIPGGVLSSQNNGAHPGNFFVERASSKEVYALKSSS
jgi:hypothetical protein